MIREDPLKDICRIPVSHLRKVERISGIAPVKDFSPDGSKSESSYSWQRISQAVLIRDDYTCRLCGKSDIVSTARDSFHVHLSVEVHHIIPRSSGGSGNFENLITLCEECHHKTFGNGYSGIPINRDPPLESFAKKRLVALPHLDNWTCSSEPLNAKLLDYRRVDVDEGAVIEENEGSEVDAIVYGLSVEEYSRLATWLELDYGITDYCTMLFRSGSAKIPARVFLAGSRIFL